jgi:hypothetical protein
MCCSRGGHTAAALAAWTSISVLLLCPACGEPLTEPRVRTDAAITGAARGLQNAQDAAHASSFVDWLAGESAAEHIVELHEASALNSLPIHEWLLERTRSAPRAKALCRTDQMSHV